MEKQMENSVVAWIDGEPECEWNGVEYYNHPCMIHILANKELFNRDGIDVVWNTYTEEENAIEREMANQWKTNWWDLQEERNGYEKKYEADADGRYDCKIFYTDEENAIEREMANQWKTNWWDLQEERNGYEKKYEADADGRYDCKIFYTDLDGSYFFYEIPDFVVDQTKPSVSVEKIGRENTGEEEYLLEIEECNFSSEKTNVYETKNVGEKKEWKKVNTSWYRIGDKVLTQIKLDDQCVDELIIQSEDLAGNQTEYRKELRIEGEKTGKEENVDSFWAAMIVLAGFFFLTVYTGLRKIFL